MEETKEIRCINKNGAVRWISEHLIKQPGYLEKNGLSVQHLDGNGKVEKTHFEATKEKKEPAKSIEEDDFSTVLGEEKTKKK